MWNGNFNATVCKIAVLTALIGSYGSVFAETSDDGWNGPRVVTDSAFDQTLVVLNIHIQDKYRQDDIFAALTEPQQPEFAVAAKASGNAAEIAESQDSGAFGYTVSNGASLDSGLALFNFEMAQKGTDLFIQIAQGASEKSEAFSMAAKGVGLDALMDQYRETLTENSGFGKRIHDGQTLEASVDSLNQRLKDQEVREIRLAGAVPPVDGSRLDIIMVAFSYSY